MKAVTAKQVFRRVVQETIRSFNQELKNCGSVGKLIKMPVCYDEKVLKKVMKKFRKAGWYLKVFRYPNPHSMDGMVKAISFRTQPFKENTDVRASTTGPTENTVQEGVSPVAEG